MIQLLPLLMNRYTLTAAAGALVVAGSVWFWNGKTQEWKQAGYDQAIEEVELKQIDIQRELSKERSRLVTRIRELEKENAEDEALVAKFRASSAAAARRLRDQEREFDAKLQRADAQALRDYAKDSDGNLERCREDRSRFAAEAASCSGTAHTLKKYIDALP